jgi:hypothetical protein
MSRKAIGFVQTYPFDVLGDSTPADYKKMREEGRKEIAKMRQAPPSE